MNLLKHSKKYFTDFQQMFLLIIIFLIIKWVQNKFIVWKDVITLVKLICLNTRKESLKQTKSINLEKENLIFLADPNHKFLLNEKLEEKVFMEKGK